MKRLRPDEEGNDGCANEGPVPKSARLLGLEGDAAQQQEPFFNFIPLLDEMQREIASWCDAATRLSLSLTCRPLRARLWPGPGLSVGHVADAIMHHGLRALYDFAVGELFYPVTFFRPWLAAEAGHVKLADDVLGSMCIDPSSLPGNSRTAYAIRRALEIKEQGEYNEDVFHRLCDNRLKRYHAACEFVRYVMEERKLPVSYLDPTSVFPNVAHTLVAARLMLGYPPHGANDIERWVTTSFIPIFAALDGTGRSFTWLREETALLHGNVHPPPRITDFMSINRSHLPCDYSANTTVTDQVMQLFGNYPRHVYTWLAQYWDFETALHHVNTAGAYDALDVAQNILYDNYVISWDDRPRLIDAIIARIADVGDGGDDNGHDFVEEIIHIYESISTSPAARARLVDAIPASYVGKLFHHLCRAYTHVAGTHLADMTATIANPDTSFAATVEHVLDSFASFMGDCGVGSHPRYNVDNMADADSPGQQVRPMLAVTKFYSPHLLYALLKHPLHYTGMRLEFSLAYYSSKVSDTLLAAFLCANGYPRVSAEEIALAEVQRDPQEFIGCVWYNLMARGLVGIPCDKNVALDLYRFVLFDGLTHEAIRNLIAILDAGFDAPWDYLSLGNVSLGDSSTTQMLRRDLAFMELMEKHAPPIDSELVRLLSEKPMTMLGQRFFRTFYCPLPRRKVDVKVRDDLVDSDSDSDSDENDGRGDDIYLEYSY